VTPCRIFDSRSGQALSPGIVQPVQVTGACQIPAAAKAVSVNITVVGPNGAGYIVFYPGDEVPPLSSAINYRAGQTRANNAILKLGAAGNLAALSIQEGWAVDVIVDVNGYFQ